MLNSAKKPLRIVHLATSDIGGGAFTASYRLHQGLTRLGVVSEMVVARKHTDDSCVYGASTPLKKVWSRIAQRIDQIPRRFLTTPNKSMLSPSFVPGDAIQRALALEPDVVNLHWVQSGFLNPASLRLLRDVPTVWTLHDMWTFCGAEHYVGDDRRYIEGYNPQNRPSGEAGLDVNRWAWQRKMRTVPAMKRLAIVSDSVWLGDCAARSAMLRGKRIIPINYGLDTEIFKPISKDVARHILNIRCDEKVVLFGALHAASDERKGIDLLAAALQRYSQAKTVHHVSCYVFGASGPREPLDFGFPTHYLGSFSDNIALAVLYSAADVMIVPSREEAFGQTALEALSCGTPVVAFRVGGLVDTIRHEQNGYLAEPFQTQDLARGIGFVLENDERQRMLSNNARRTALEGFTLEHQARRYIEVYSELLSQQR